MPNAGPEPLVAVVLAGGFGTRIRHLLPGIPKPMAPVAGKPFLEWVIRFLAKQGLTQVVLSTGYLSQVIEDHFAPQPVSGVEVRCVMETEPLGTAGGFLHAVRLSGKNAAAWLVLNGDSLCFSDIPAAVAGLNGFSGCLIGCRLPEASRYGTMSIGPHGELLGFHEKRPGQGIINAGMYLLRHHLLQQFPTESPLSFEKDVFPAFTSRNFRLGVRVESGPFLDIGTPESLTQAESFISKNQAQFRL